MNIVLLGKAALRLICLRTPSNNLFYATEPECLEKIFNEHQINYLFSYGYRYIVPQKHLDLVEGLAVNLHIGLLPHNRGAHPNLWANLENSPSGVTIHKMTIGMDEGPIVAQEKLFINDELTFKQSYDILTETIETLFEKNCWDLIHNNFSLFEQVGGGNCHRLIDYELVKPIMRSGWDTVIKDAKKDYFHLLKEQGYDELCCIHENGIQ